MTYISRDYAPNSANLYGSPEWQDSQIKHILAYEYYCTMLIKASQWVAYNNWFPSEKLVMYTLTRYAIYSTGITLFFFFKKKIDNSDHCTCTDIHFHSYEDGMSNRASLSTFTYVLHKKGQG